MNDVLITGMRVIDSLFSIGRGQRQLILGDRYTGKTTIYLSVIIRSSTINLLFALDGLGSVRVFGVYVGINQNLSKLARILHYIGLLNFYSVILATHSSSSALLSFVIPCIGVSISERLRDKGYDICICFDDLIKHSKAYRQCSLLLSKIPSRDAYPADIFNVHSSLLERCGKLRVSYFGGSISAFPVIESINADITEYIATNVISITDGQFYTSRVLFINSNRPAIDSALSVSRIGSNSQCRLLKSVSLGIKNELTNYRLTTLDSTSLAYFKLAALNTIYYQDYLLVSSVELTVLLLVAFRAGLLLHNLDYIHFLGITLAWHWFYLPYLI